MCRIIVVLLLAASFADYIEGWSKISNTNSRDDQRWYKYHFMPETWTSARLRCYHEGGILASPINSNLQELMVTVLQNATTSSTASVFTGISAIYSEGEFYSVEGVSIENIVIDWLNEQPTYKKALDRCITMYRGGQLALTNCDEKHPYLCYTTQNPEQKTNECGIVPGYTFNAETKHCFKFHKSNVVWSEAFKICAAEGGYLTIINSHAEAQMLEKLYHKKYFSIYAVWIGGSNWDENGLWMTIHGQTLEEAGYARWDDGQPNEDDFYCLALNNRNYKLITYPCNRHNAAFICEKNIE